MAHTQRREERTEKGIERRLGNRAESKEPSREPNEEENRREHSEEELWSESDELFWLLGETVARTLPYQVQPERRLVDASCFVQNSGRVSSSSVL